MIIIITHTLYSPLSRIWCMRFEAKHRYFKHIAKAMGNFKNIPKTLAFRHQRYMSYVLNTETYCKDSIEVGPSELYV